ncbi:MAG: hypothetical protein KAS74_02175 [Methanosarcinales archaeon]|nr:hypothetical protein [Methanosarcinales archaeon]
MKKIPILILCLVMLTGVASAGYEHDELTRYVDYYNKHVESVPEFLNPIIGDQTINVHILTGDEIDLVFGMRTDGMSVAEFSNEPFADPGMDVYIKQSLIDRVLAQDRALTKERIKQELAAEDSGLAALRAAYNEACDSGEFRCVPHRIGLTIRMIILKLLI